MGGAFMQTKTAPMQVALLRGINVGGRNRLPMATLIEIASDLGAQGCATYIQSGNLVFQDRRDPSAFAELLRAALARRVGLEVPVVVRSARELEAAIANCPFADLDPTQVYVAFLADRPSAEAAARLDPDRSAGDRFVLSGRELYLHLPNGVARTKLTNAYLDRCLQTTSTVRNWKTTLELGRRLHN